MGKNLNTYKRKKMSERKNSGRGKKENKVEDKKAEGNEKGVRVERRKRSNCIGNKRGRGMKNHVLEMKGGR